LSDDKFAEHFPQTFSLDQLTNWLAMNSPVAAGDAEPQYWEFLSDSDKASYLQLKRDFTETSMRHGRNTRLETFDGILEAIRHFAERNDDQDWRRFLVCGVCWMDNAIAINTRQLRILVSKCKSSINGSLQKMGYTTNMSHSESWKILFPRIPLLKDHFSELRQWTIRYKGPIPPPPFIPMPGAMALAVPIPSQQPLFEQPSQQSDKRPSCPIKFRAKMNRRPETEP
jgi:hypothetical protein